MAASAWRPAERPAAENMRVHVPHRLPRLRSGVEHDAVSGLIDTFRFGYPLRLAGQFIEQPAPSLGSRGQVRIVLLGYHEHMSRRLGVDVTERERAVTLQYPRCWDHTSHNLAEKAVGHRRDLNVRAVRGYCLPSVAPAAPAPRALTRRMRTSRGVKPPANVLGT